MKKLVNELSEKEINYWAAKTEGHPVYDKRSESWSGNITVTQERFEHPIIVIGLTGGISIEDHTGGQWFDPCNNPAQSWPIIEREKITIYPYNGMWVALSLKSGKRIYGDTSLIAAMRCRIAMVYGDSVEVDDEQKRT